MGLAPLLAPVGPDFMKNFPALNTVNCDNIDNYAGPCLTTSPLQTYTPNLGAITTTPVLGTTGAILRGIYYRIFDQVWVWGDFRFGTGFSSGSGSIKISLPFEVDSLQGPSAGPGLAPMLGVGYLYDASASATRQTLICQLATTTEIMFNVKMASGAASRTVTGNNSPITWAVDDGISWFVRYKKVA